MIQSRIRHFGLFEISLSIVGIVLITVFAIIFFRKNAYVTVTVKVTNANVLYDEVTPPFWYAAALRPGAAELDSFGKKQAEILSATYYPTESTDKITFLRLRIRGIYSRSKRQYAYKGKALIVGSNIRIELQNQLIDGIITEIEDEPSPFIEKELIIQTKIRDLNIVYQETEGVPDYIAKAITIGDTMKDSNGKTVLTVLDKIIVPADRYVTTNGRIIVVKDPLKKDVYLTLKLSTINVNGENIFLHTYKVKVGEKMIMDLPNITIQPVITEIRSEKP